MLFQINTTEGNLNSLDPLPFNDVSNFGKLEKDLENLIAENLLEVLFEGSPILPVFQERNLQSEADIYGINKNGDLIIFELKRGTAGGDAVLQLLKYAQDCGNWSYKTIEEKFQKYTNSDEKLAEVHKNEFGLDRNLEPLEFNRNQHLIIVGNASDDYLINSVDYWKEKGVSIQFVPYRIYKIKGELFFELFAHPYDKHHNPKNIKGVIFDTNRSYCEECIWDMFKKNRISAYGDRKGVVGYLSNKDIVFYSHKNFGIVAAGKVKGPVKSDEPDEKFREVEFLTKLPTSDTGLKNYLRFSEVSSILEHGFFWARTIKYPYLSKKESEILLKALKNRLAAT